MERCYKRADESTDMESGEKKVVAWKSRSKLYGLLRVITSIILALSHSAQSKKGSMVQNKTLSLMHGAVLNQ